ncbi:amino acid--tRNA ligase-related protein, partial [Streptomyces microflavus]|uniref:amino acid--tRNA ligase-related protein n=1 Tax=Streptomyces microflavus TaxID=1919 RepID=UPI003400746C
AELDDPERERLRTYFREHIFPVLTPLAVDPAHPFPYISGRSLNLAVAVRDPDGGSELFARVKVPNNVPRFVRVARDQPGLRMLPVEELISVHLGQLYSGMQVVECHLFRVTRNAEVEVDEELDEDLLQALERELARRRFGPPVRLEVAASISDHMLELLVRELDMDGHDVLRVPGLLDLSALWLLYGEADRPDLKDKPFVPATHPRLAEGEVPRSVFATLRDGDGTELQAMLSLDRVGAERLDAWKRLVDLGDHVGVTGEVITSRRGELSVLADEWAVTAKALRPLPVAHKPLSEEARVRQRYVDLVVRPQARQMVRTRAAAVRSLRDSLHGQGFIEVETPMLQLLHGGAAARPFVTHSNALGTDLYLRIAPELFLKRAVVGGVDRVFEINRNFRNEGVDSSHSPEFAMLETYQAYGDYDTMAALTRNLVQQAAVAVSGSTTVTHADGREFDLGGEWRSVTLFGALSEALGEEVTVRTERTRLVEYADKVGLAV